MYPPSLSTCTMYLGTLVVSLAHCSDVLLLCMGSLAGERLAWCNAAT